VNERYPALELRGITKRFPGGVVANDCVDLTVRTGEVHAVIGENGAGKSTLMSIVYGMVQPDSGEIRVNGSPIKITSPQAAIGAGLGMVHQHFKLFPSLTVAENVVYGSEPRRGRRFDRAAAEQRVRELSERYQLPVDPSAKVADLAVGVRQRIEILKALYREAKTLILDEPTAVLTPHERDALFDVLRLWCADGHTAVLITHKLPEVMAVAQNVTVMRRGRVVAEVATADSSPAELAKAMTGRTVNLEVRPALRNPGDVVLGVDALQVQGVHARAVEGVSFDVRAGEIVTIAGVAGNGQTELVEAICGLRPVDAGTIRIGGEDVTRASITERRASMAYVPEDRQRVGTAGQASIRENLLMGFQRRYSSSKGWLDRRRISKHAADLVQQFDIRVSGIEEPVNALSGGNLQKVVVARELTHSPDLLVADQPIRGVDIGAIEFIHGKLIEERDRGAAILLVSSELWEVISLSTRILVMFEGRIVGELDPASTDEAEIGLYMAGVVR